MTKPARLVSGFSLACQVLAAAAQAATWTPAPTLPVDARKGAAGVNHNGTIFALGGRPFEIVEGDPRASVHYLPPKTYPWEWQSGVALASPIMHPGAGIDALGRLIVVGGYTVEDHFPFFFPLTGGYVYDVATGPGAGLPDFTFARARFAYATDAQHRLYVIGGLDVGGDTTDFTERYDAAADLWAILAPLPEPRAKAGAAYDGQGHVLVIGGADVNDVPQPTVFSYDVIGESWSTINPPPVPLEGQAAVLGANGIVYAVGGTTRSGSHTNAVHMLDPNLGLWMIGPSMITARSGAAAVLGNEGFIYAIGGYSGTLGTNTVERLDTRWCLADFNQSGRIDFTDLIMFAAAWQSRVGEPNYDPMFDISGNGQVDFTDFTYLSHYWNTPCP